MEKAVISINNLDKAFHIGIQEVQVLKNITFDIKEKDFVIIFGPSGCGKSTLLHSILGLRVPSKGTVHVLGKNLYDQTTEDDRSEFRKRHMGMVYQQPNWIKSLTVLENVAFPLLLVGTQRKESLEKARGILRSVGMEDWANYVPTELSSGQQQKVSLARALIINPEILIADEPTGNLDYQSAQELMELLAMLNRDQEKTVVMVTHDLNYLTYSKTAVKMFNGEIVETYDGKEKNKILQNVKIKKGVTNE